jgi:hypothetical protein
VVFVRKSPGRSGSTKVQIAERCDGRDVVVEHVGTARTDAELAVLMAAARQRLLEGQEALDREVAGLEDEGVPQRPGLITSKRSALLWQVLTEAYARLAFDATVTRRSRSWCWHGSSLPPSAPNSRTSSTRCARSIVTH